MSEPRRDSSLHRNIIGREQELRSLVDAVRRLVRFATNHVAPADRTAEIAQQIHALADRLEPLVPAAIPPRYDLAGLPSAPHDFFPYDPVLGHYNPLAVPIEMEWQPPKAVGRVRFDTPYEGPPGCVHGAVLAGAFDQVLNVANLKEGCPGPTATLELEFRRPTPLHETLIFESWVESREARKVTTRGHVRFGDEICVAAVGLFIAVDLDRIRSLLGDDDPIPGSGAEPS